jgi:ATP-dependent exoDNAse (exonuclease V) beta subunit
VTEDQVVPGVGPHVGTVGDDAEARAAIASAVDQTVVASAGAGTGKTTALVDRLLNVVLRGRAAIGEVAVVTFTEAAAAELRVRLRAALGEAAAGRPWRVGAPVPPVDAELAVERARRALAEIDDALVTTLHGFARAILRSHPLAAGIPPVFSVLDESAAAAAAESEWGAAAAELFEDAAWREVVERALVLGIDGRALGALYRALGANWDRLDERSAQPAPPVPPGRLPAVDVAAVVDPLRVAIAAAGTCTDPDDLLCQHLRRLEPVVGRLVDAGDDLDRLVELVAAPSLRCGRGRKEAWPGPTVGDVRQLCTDAETARAQLLDQVRRQCLELLGGWVAARVVGAATARARRGELTFHDLLALARRVVRDDPGVAAAVGRRWPRLFLDELQDTDPVQAELAVRLAARRPDGDRPWTELEVEPGRLFLVGDAKQAIYRFRRADIAVVDDLGRTVGGRTVELGDSWRSVPGIVAWVNAVIGGLFGEGVPGVQPAYQPLRARRPAGRHAHPPVVVLGGPDPEPRSADQRRQEAMADVAAAAAAAIGRWPVDDGRPARPDDICILLPTRTGLRHLEAALEEAQLPYRFDSGSLIYASGQVRDVLAVLGAVDDPVDPVRLLAALRTPLLGCTDHDLARYRAAGGRWRTDDPLPGGLDPDEPVPAALRLLGELRQRRWWDDPATLVDEVVERTAATVLALDERRWVEAWRRLRFLQAEARTFTDQVGGDLRQFLAWTSWRSDEHVRTAEVDLVDDEGGAVHVMTVHGAKGLEFPICIVAGFDSRPRGRPSVDALFTGTGVELRVGDARTAGYDALREHEERCHDAEHVRLLYVGCTRARDHLVVAVHHDERRGSLAGAVYQACQERPDLWISLDALTGATGSAARAPDVGGRPVHRPAGHDPGAAAGAVLRDADAAAAASQAWQRRREERLQQAERPAVVTASAVAHALAELGPHDGRPAAETPSATGRVGTDRQVDHEADDQDEPVDEEGAGGEWSPVRRGRGATAIGRAVHASLQVVDLATGAELAAIAGAAAAAEGVPEQAAHVAQLAQAALDSDLVRRAVLRGRLWREVYVGAPIGGQLVEGIVDLLVDDDDGLHVVDYKTDLLPDEAAVDAAVARHQHQIGTYALLVAATTGRTVADASLLFLRAGADAGRSAGRAVARTLAGEVLERVVADVRSWLNAGCPRRGTGPGSGVTAPCPG